MAIQWIRRHADPDECLVILIALCCVWAGFSTWADLGGKPRDAPHLRIPGEIRAFMWWGCALVGLGALRLRRRCVIRRWAHSFIGLGFMITFRLGSYLGSWVASWKFFDMLLDDDVIKGDSHAWGSMWLYVIGEIAIACLMLAPYDWNYLDSKERRKGRLERHERGSSGAHGTRNSALRKSL